MKTFLAATAFALTLGGAAQAVTIGFEGLNAGDDQGVPVLSFSESGFSFDLSFRPSGGAATNLGAAIFDTTCATYGTRECDADPDLELSDARQGESDVSGNVLILQDDTRDFASDGSIVIDDDAQSGGIIFTVTGGAPFQITGFSVLDDVTITLLEGDGGPTRDRFIGQAGTPADNGTAQVSGLVSPIFNIGDTFAFRYSGSGALDSIVLAPVPLPAGLPLLMAGLGGLALMRRRNRATS